MASSHLTLLVTDWFPLMLPSERISIILVSHFPLLWAEQYVFACQPFGSKIDVTWQNSSMRPVLSSLSWLFVLGFLFLWLNLLPVYINYCEIETWNISLFFFLLNCKNALQPRCQMWRKLFIYTICLRKELLDFSSVLHLSLLSHIFHLSASNPSVFFTASVCSC